MYDGRVITFRRYLAIAFLAAPAFLIAGDMLTGIPTEGFGAGYLAGKIGAAVVFLLLGMIGAGFAMRSYGPPTKQAAWASILPAVAMYFGLIGLADDAQVDNIMLWGLLLSLGYFASVVLIATVLAQPRASVDPKLKQASGSGS